MRCCRLYTFFPKTSSLSPFAFYFQVSKRPIFKKKSPAGGCWSRREAPHPWVPALQILAGFCHQVRAPRVRAPTGARTYLQFSKISKKILYKFPRWLLHYLTFGAPLGKIFFTNTRARDKLLRNCLGLFCPSNTLKSYIPGCNFPSFLSQ